MEYPIKVFDHWVENHSGIEGYVTEINGDCVTIQTLGVTSGPWTEALEIDPENYNSDTKQLCAWLRLYIDDFWVPTYDEARGEALSILVLSAHYAKMSVAAGANCAWLGSSKDTYYAYFVYSGGSVGSIDRNYSYVVAPAFNLSKSVLTRDKNGDLRILDETRASERTILAPPLSDSSKTTLFGGIADEE